MPKRKNTEDFIRQSKSMYPDQFDYRDCIYSSAKTKTTLLCLLHAQEEPVHITPSHHLNASKGSGCRLCKNTILSHKFRADIDHVAKVAKESYGEKFDFLIAEYKNAQSLIAGFCKVHNKRFKTTYDEIQQQRCSGCDDCKATRRTARGKLQSSRKIIPFEQFLSEANTAHDKKYTYIQDTYKGFGKNVSYNCNNCRQRLSTRASRHLLGVGCKTCYPKKQNTLFSETEILAKINLVQEDHYNVFLLKRESKASDSIFSLQCINRPGPPKLVSYSRAMRKQRCLLCNPKACSKILKLRRKYPEIRIESGAIDVDSNKIEFLCTVHNVQEQSLNTFTKYGCCLCVQSANKTLFYQNTPMKTQNKTEYSAVYISEAKLETQELSFVCKKHRTKYVQLAKSHMSGLAGCSACKGDAIVASKNLNAHKNQKKNIKQFMKRALECHPSGNYSYPNIENEYYLKSSLITIHCNVHELDLPPFPANAHLSAGQRRGRGCAKCKSDKARQSNRLPWDDVTKYFEAIGLTILSGEESYLNSKSELKTVCINNHSNKIKVSNVTQRNRGCPNCSGGIGEEITRIILSAYFGITFTKQRFSFLQYQYLELDGYNKEHGLAFEYQGAPHCIPNFHKNESDYKKQKQRDEDTRAMCKSMNIKLIEVQLFKNGFFTSYDILEKIREALIKAGFLFEASRLPSINKTINQAIKGNNLIKEIEEIAQQQRLELLSELVWIGNHKKHDWKCKKCNHTFSNSIDQRKNAKHKCCPACATMLGAKQSKLTRKGNNNALLVSLKAIAKMQGVNLISTKWIGSGQKQFYSGLCRYCKSKIQLNRNQLTCKKIFCKCEKWLSTHKN